MEALNGTYRPRRTARGAAAQSGVEAGLIEDQTSPDGGSQYEVTLEQRIFARLDTLMRELRITGTSTDIWSSNTAQMNATIDGISFRMGELEEGQARVLQLLQQHTDTLTEIRKHLAEPRNAA